MASPDRAFRRSHQFGVFGGVEYGRQLAVLARELRRWDSAVAAATKTAIRDWTDETVEEARSDYYRHYNRVTGDSVFGITAKEQGAWDEGGTIYLNWDKSRPWLLPQEFGHRVYQSRFGPPRGGTYLIPALTKWRKRAVDALERSVEAQALGVAVAVTNAQG